MPWGRAGGGLGGKPGYEERITPVPPSRWDHGLYYDPRPFVPDKTYCKVGAFTTLRPPGLNWEYPPMISGP